MNKASLPACLLRAIRSSRGVYESLSKPLVVCFEVKAMLGLFLWVLCDRQRRTVYRRNVLDR